MTGPRDSLIDAHRAGVEAVTSAWERLHEQGPGYPYEHGSGPFCGCEDCEVRVILEAAYPHVRGAVLAEVLR